MAVPTITSIDSSSGHTGGGQLVEIIGTNFRTRTGATAEIPDPYEHKTVEVEFSGTSAGDAWSNLAEEVWVESETKLRVRVPEFLGNPNVTGILNDDLTRVDFPAATVTVRNLDDDGDLIPTEEVSSASAYTYQQPLLALPEAESPIGRVLRQLLRTLKRQVLRRVAIRTHTDYGDSSGRYTLLSDNPGIDLTISVEPDLDYNYFDNEPVLVDDGSGKWQRWQGTKTVLLNVGLSLSADNENITNYMISAMIDLSLRTPWLTVEADPNYIGATEPNKYPLEHVDFPQQVGRASRLNVIAFDAQLRVRGIPILSDDPDQIVYPRTTVRLITSDMDGTAFHEVSS